MTTSRPEDFPAAISIEELKQLHKSATTEASAQAEGSELYQERIERVSAEIIKEMSEKFDDHMIPKLVILRLIAQMAGWAVENQKLAAEVARENTVNATQFYTPTPIADPVKPLAPLPVEGVPPSPEIQKGGLGIDIGLKVLDTYQNYIDMQPGESDREANTTPTVNIPS